MTSFKVEIVLYCQHGKLHDTVELKHVGQGHVEPIGKNIHVFKRVSVDLGMILNVTCMWYIDNVFFTERTTPHNQLANNGDVEINNLGILFGEPNTGGESGKEG